MLLINGVGAFNSFHTLNIGATEACLREWGTESPTQINSMRVDASALPYADRSFKLYNLFDTGTNGFNTLHPSKVRFTPSNF